MFQLACSMLRDAGYGHYEVSNWARPGYECRHNLGYWRRQPYLGLGAGAHSYRDDRRWWNVRPPEEYLATVERGELPIGGEESLDPSDAYLEEVFLRLRILEGVPSSWVEDDRSGAVRRERPAPRRRWLARADRARHAAAQRARAGAGDEQRHPVVHTGLPSRLDEGTYEGAFGPSTIPGVATIESGACRRCAARVATRPSTWSQGRAATPARRAARSGDSWSAARAGRGSTRSRGRPPGPALVAACFRMPRRNRRPRPRRSRRHRCR